MPAAAVIPTPRVYLNVAAVKKLVVELLAVESALSGLGSHPLGEIVFLLKVLLWTQHFTLKKLECSWQAKLAYISME